MANGKLVLMIWRGAVDREVATKKVKTRSGMPLIHCIESSFAGI